MVRLRYNAAFVILRGLGAGYQLRAIAGWWCGGMCLVGGTRWVRTGRKSAGLSAHRERSHIRFAFGGFHLHGRRFTGSITIPLAARVLFSSARRARPVTTAYYGWRFSQRSMICVSFKDVITVLMVRSHNTRDTSGREPKVRRGVETENDHRHLERSPQHERRSIAPHLDCSRPAFCRDC
jgi:hypothetical protein